MTLQDFYKEDELVQLLEESSGEILNFIGIVHLNQILKIYRHVTLGTVNMIEVYEYNLIEKVLYHIGEDVLTSDTDHETYRKNYKLVINNWWEI